VYWNNEPIDEAALPERFARAAAAPVQPELHLRADRDTRYQVIARIMAHAQSAGLKKIGFVTDPAPERP
jgi:biopolymer transport protein ExbD